MTKLLEWLFGVSVVGAVWAVVTFDLLNLSLPQTYREVAWPMPVYLLVSFGCYSLATVGYRVATFNDCEEAAKELQEQIKRSQRGFEENGLKDVKLEMDYFETFEKNGTDPRTTTTQPTVGIWSH